MWLMNWLAQTSTMSELTNLGAAGIMGAMWLWERRTSRQREQQLDEAHQRILGDRVGLEQLMDVVRQNAEALSRFAALHEQWARSGNREQGTGNRD